MPTPYYLNPKATKLPAGHDESLDPVEAPTDAARRGVPPSRWPRHDTSPGPRGPRDRPAGPPPTDPHRRSLPPFDWARTPGLGWLGDLDPDIAMWPITTVQRWPFSGPPTSGFWPKAWMGLDNTATAWVCTQGGQPGTWAPLGGAQAVFTPDDFGAVGDGVHDDSAAIQAAITAANAVSGGGPGQAIVQGVQGKDYFVNYNAGPITTPPVWGTIYCGAIMAAGVCVQNMSIITPFWTPTDAAHQSAVFGIPNGTNNWSIRGCQFNGGVPSSDNTETFNYAVLGGSCSNVVFSDNYVTAFRGGACALGTPISNVRYERNYITLTNSNPLKNGGAASFFFVRDNWIIDCQKMVNLDATSPVPSTEAVIVGAQGSSVDHVYLTGNHVRNYQGLLVIGAANSVVITDNTHTMTAACVNAPLIHGPSAGVGAGGQAVMSHIVIAHNTVDFSALNSGSASGAGHFGVQFFATTATNIVIEGNTVLMGTAAGSAAPYGMNVTVFALSSGFKIANNLILGLTTLASARGIFITATGGGMDGSLTGNQLVGVASGAVGVQFANGGGPYNFLVSDNLFSNASVGGMWPTVLRLQNNAGFNPVGSWPVTVPASGSAVSYPFAPATTVMPFDGTFYINTTTAAVTIVLAFAAPTTGARNQSITIPTSTTNFPLRVPAGTTLTPTYTVAPTWQWASN